VELLAVGIVFPHSDQVFGADDQGFSVVIILKHLGQRSGHHGLAQAHHIGLEKTQALRRGQRQRAIG